MNEPHAQRRADRRGVGGLLLERGTARGGQQGGEGLLTEDLEEVVEHLVRVRVRVRVRARARVRAEKCLPRLMKVSLERRSHTAKLPSASPSTSLPT